MSIPLPVAITYIHKGPGMTNFPTVGSEVGQNPETTLEEMHFNSIFFLSLPPTRSV